MPQYEILKNIGDMKAYQFTRVNLHPATICEGNGVVKKGAYGNYKVVACEQNGSVYKGVELFNDMEKAGEFALKQKKGGRQSRRKALQSRQSRQSRRNFS